MHDDCKITFESEAFFGSRWSAVGYIAPDQKPGRDPTARLYAELAWYELCHLVPGEACQLRGRFEAFFYKTKERELQCFLPDGRSGRYNHNGRHTDPDAAWAHRRELARRLVKAIEDGDDWPFEDDEDLDLEWEV